MQTIDRWHPVVRPLASIVLGLWVINAYVWADAWTVLHPDENACRTAIYHAAVAAQTVDPSVREIDAPRECRGFTGEQLDAFAASLARPKPTRSATPTPSPTQTTASPSPTPRRQTSSPSPTTERPSPTITASRSATAGPTPTPSASVVP